MASNRGRFFYSVIYFYIFAFFLIFALQCWPSAAPLQIFDGIINKRLLLFGNTSEFSTFKQHNPKE